MRHPVVAALAVALLAACGTRGASTTSGTRIVAVVAAENFWGDVAAQVGGVHAHVKSLISDPTADPHLYESDARGRRAAIADASVVVENGLGYDDFVGDLLSSTTGRKHVVNAAKAMGFDGDNANPHVWYAIERVPQVARAIADALTAADPTDSAFFAARATRFEASLRPVLDALNGIKAAYADAPVAYTERVPEYVVQEAGLANRTPEGFASAIEDGNEPSARDTKAMNDLVRSHAIKVLLYNSQATSPVTDAVRDHAQRSDVAVVGITETMPKRAPSYQAWMLEQLHALERGTRIMSSVVSMRRAGVRFGSRVLFEDLDLDVAPGEFLAVLGPNGAGKTTFLRVLLGLTTLSSGLVEVDARIGYIPQQHAFDRDLPIRGRDLVRLGVDGERPGMLFTPRRTRARVDEALDAVDARAFADSRIGVLSGGEQQRLRVAQALVADPQLLLCDEPLLSLDLSQQGAVSERIDRRRREQGTAVVFVTHEINPILPYVDRVLYIVDGQWAVGPPSEVLTSAQLSALYRTTVDVLEVRGRIVVVGGDGENLTEPHGHRHHHHP